MVDKFNIRQKHSILVVLMLIILTLGVYWPVQNYEFINYDDNIYVTDNYHTQSGLTLKSIIETFKDTNTGLWHPLTLMSHMLDWELFGNNAGGHHWTNVIIHIFNTVLLFLFFHTLTGAIWRSAFVAALFAIHPINVESVAWIAERKNVLSTFFWILTMLFYVRYVKLPNWKRYLPVFLCFALGLMSKPMLVTLPFVLLLLDYWPLDRTTIGQQNEGQTKAPAFAIQKRKISFLILEKIPLFVLSVISICLTFYAAQYLKSIVSLETLSLAKRISNAIVSYILYIKKLVWPTDLAVFYPLSYISIWQISIAALFLVGVTVFVCKCFRKYPYLLVGWFWYLGTLVPVIGLVQNGSHAMADRYAYIPLIGLFVLIVWGMGDMLKKIFSTKLIAIISGMTLAALIIVSHYQIQYWRNTFTIFNHAVNVTKDNYIAHSYLAGEFLARNNLKETIHHCQIALSLDSTNYNSLVRMATAYELLGEKNKAIDALRLAIKGHPEYVRAYNDLYVFLLQAGKAEEAEEALKECRKAVELPYNKDNLELHYNFGNTLATHGHYDEAVIQYNQVLCIQPQNAFAHNNLAMMLLRQGKIDDALNHFREAIRLKPKFANAHYQLELILKQKGLTEEANRHYQGAIRINPGYEDKKIDISQ